MNYIILQPNSYCEYAFESWASAKEVFSLTDYHVVYSGSIDGTMTGFSSEDEFIHAKLEDLFMIFNMKIPEDFKGHSMSLSDIVILDGVVWYCDSFGFVNVTGETFETQFRA